MTRTDSRSLRFGIATVVTDSSIPTVELAQWAEDRSFESLFMGGALLATTVATLDRVSAGPFLFGIGGGWNPEEMANVTSKKKRRAT